jgi:F0F1-type ATP synthase assembly protein I
MGFGYFADRQFESEPIGLIIGAVIGFLAMLLRIVRMRPSNDLKDLNDPSPQSTDTASKENESNK